MAVKNEAQIVTVLQKAQLIHDNLLSYLTGTYETDINALETALDAGDKEPADKPLRDAVETMNGSLGTAYNDVLRVFGACHMLLGRLGSSSDLGDVQKNIDAHFDYIESNSLAYKKRGWTKGTITAGGSNAGNGTFCTYDNDPNSDIMDYGHVETFTLLCRKDQFSNATEGSEQFLMTGAANGNYAWSTKGSGSGAAYLYVYGAKKDFGPDQPTKQTGDYLTSVYETNETLNIIQNGGFEQTIASSGTDKVPRWTISTGDGTLVLANATSPISGAQDMAWSAGATTMYQNIETRMKAKTVYFMECYLNSSGTTLTGTFTYKIKDDNTTHATISKDISTLVIGTKTKLTYTSFILPQNVGDNLRAELECTVGGTGTPVLKIDKVCLTKGTIVDGRALAIFSGLTPWRLNDTATIANTCTDGGKLERLWNLVYGRYMPNAAAATTFADG